jgi:hypothetical protein
MVVPTTIRTLCNADESVQIQLTWNDVIFDWRKYNGMTFAANSFGLCITKHRP